MSAAAVSVTPETLVASGTLSVLEWTRERYANCLRLSRRCRAEDRAGWLEDAWYFLSIVRQLEGSEAVMVNAIHVEPGMPVVCVRDDGYARHALITAVRRAEAHTQPIVDCVMVDDAGNIDSRTGVSYVDDAPPNTMAWRRPLDHPTPAESAYESTR